MVQNTTFKPRFSILGWLISILIPCLLVIYIYFVLFKVDGLVISTILLIIFSIASILFLLIYPTISYSIDNEKLILKCGPFNDIIYLEDIKKISQTNLRYHITSTGWKLPGYALFTIYYADRGKVKMYATSLLKNIILIETEIGLYGVTPKEEQKFISMIKEQMS